MKLRLTSLVLAVALLGSFAFGASRAQAAPKVVGGAAGLVAAVLGVNVELVDNNILNNVDVRVIDLDDVLNNSLNNLRALNNILNNSPILSGNDINVEDIDVLTGDILSDIDVDIDFDDIIVAVLSNVNGDLIVLTR